MAPPRCKFCDTNLCTIIIFFKWILDYIFFHTYSKSWERSLPAQRRASQRMKKFKIRSFQYIPITLAILHMIVTCFNTDHHTKMNILSVIATAVYLFTFWLVIQGREEFRIQHRAYHWGKERDPYSRISMTDHVKTVVAIISYVEILSCTSLIHDRSMWILVTVLQLFSCYFFFNKNFRSLFPSEQNRDNELVYKIE